MSYQGPSILPSVFYLAIPVELRQSIFARFFLQPAACPMLNYARRSGK